MSHAGKEGDDRGNHRRAQRDQVIFWSHAWTSSRSEQGGGDLLVRPSSLAQRRGDREIPGPRCFSYAGSAVGCHRGRRRARQLDALDDRASSAASIATDDKRWSLEKVGRKRPLLETFVTQDGVHALTQRRGHSTNRRYPFTPLSGRQLVCIRERYNRYGTRLLLQVDETTRVLCTAAVDGHRGARSGGHDGQ